MSDLARVPLTAAERKDVSDEFEAACAPGLRIAEVARRFAVATEALEWALWATERGEAQRGMNRDYCERSLATRAPAWREARDDLMGALEGDASTFLARCGS